MPYYFAALIALAGNFLLSLGMVLQKKHVGWFGQRGRRDGAFRRDQYGWLLGFTFMNTQPICNFIALFGLPPNVVAAMIGTNVAFTSILAAVMLRERLGKRRILGILAIFLAVLVLTLTGGEEGRRIEGMSDGLYALFGAIPFAAAFILVTLRRRFRHRSYPTLVAAVAGALGGYMVVTMKALQLRAPQGLLGWLATPFPYIYFASGAVSFSILQLAFHRGEVTAVSPADYGLQVLWSSLASYLAFSMAFTEEHVAAILVILGAVLLIAGSGKHTASAPPAEPALSEAALPQGSTAAPQAEEGPAQRR